MRGVSGREAELVVDGSVLAVQMGKLKLRLVIMSEM